MTEEEIRVLKEAKEAAERRAAEAEAEAGIAKAEADKERIAKETVVSELQDVRAKKAEAETKLKSITNTTPETTDVNVLIEQALARKEAEKQQAELTQAVEEFKVSKPEFQADSAGLVFGKFQETLKRFNLSDVRNKAEAKARLEDVYKFMNLGSQSSELQNYSGAERITPAAPLSPDAIQRSSEELAKVSGMDTEKVKSLRSKYPDAFDGLGI
jgi:hypothetical protein